MKEIDTELFDPFQIAILHKASNETFRKLCDKYNFILQMGLDDRYKTPVIEWHAKKLRSEAFGIPYKEDEPEISMKALSTAKDAQKGMNDFGKDVSSKFKGLFK